MNIAYSILVTVVWFFSTYFMVVLLLTLLLKKSQLYSYPKMKGNWPESSIIVAAFNEEKTILSCMNSFKNLDYPKDRLWMVIVNDGSVDGTSKVVKENIGGANILFIDNVENKGKAACLNEGINASNSEFVACMDADSEVCSDVLKKTIPYFSDKRVAAVTVSVEVKDPKNFLEKIIDIEYLIGLSMSLKALSFFDTVHVTPGPFSIYRKAVLMRIGGFDEDNITEDLEIAYRLQKNKYRIENCASAKVRTKIPDSLKKLYIQRKRWYSGALMTAIQHKNVHFNMNFGVFGFVVPYMFLLVILGLSLFVFGVVLTIVNFWNTMSYYSLTHYDFLSNLLLEFDLLSLSSLSLFGASAFLSTMAFVAVCLKLSGNGVRTKLKGLSGFFLIFFLYQFFWASSFISVLFRRQLKWR